MKTTYIFHSDAGHGWLEVPLAEIAKVGLAVADFSRYSYRLGSRLFLEEDCDAPRFILAFSQKNGAPPAFSQQHTDGDFVEEMGLRSIRS